jgi:dCMP deaminase
MKVNRGAKWDRRFLELTREIAKWSKDPSTQLGCVVVGPDLEIRSTGFNGFPRGVEDHPSRYADRDLKLAIICHSEENAIMNAARIGVSLQGCDLYCGWLPCTRCARGIIQVGIKRVVIPVAEVPERWRADFELSEKILTEAGVQIVTVEP